MQVDQVQCMRVVDAEHNDAGGHQDDILVQP